MDSTTKVAQLIEFFRLLDMDSTTEVTQLPEDMIIQILLRLPVKSLVRFKLVCKTWNHLLKTSFISIHHKFITVSQLLMCTYDKNKDNHVFSFHSNDTSATVLSPDLRIPTKPGTYFHVVGSCNGIVCYSHGSSIFLTNPATREFKQLPPTSISLESDPVYKLNRFAIGFDSTNIYDFKVLCLFAADGSPYCKPTHELKAEIFTLSSNTWKQLHWGLDRKYVFDGDRPPPSLFFANSFHVIVFDVSVFDCGYWRQAIACCDIHTERFGIMELASGGEGYFKSLMVYKEFLSTVCISKNDEIHIWIMEDYGFIDSWTKLCCIKPPWPLTKPVCFWTVDDALLWRLSSQLVSYRFDTGRFESTEIHGYNKSYLTIHQETLVSIM